MKNTILTNKEAEEILSEIAKGHFSLFNSLNQYQKSKVLQLTVSIAVDALPIINKETGINYFIETDECWELAKNDVNEELNRNPERRDEFREFIFFQRIADRMYENINNYLPPEKINSKTDTKKYTAKYYVLAYFFDCNATGKSLPSGNKKELERIGNERMGEGKGNRFYKVFNEVIKYDLNVEQNYVEIGGENWRKAVIELSKAPELVERYLQSKQL
jgi:hypothetical protein